jgi:Uma2 family endonuclease
MSIETQPQEIAVTVLHSTPPPMSYEEYLDWEHEGGLAEWVDGEVVIHMPPKNHHQNVVEFLHLLIGLFVNLLRLGKVRIAPFAMRVRPDGPGREPDLFFLAEANMNRLSERELSGSADLVIEVISDDSVARDRSDKFYEYQDGGVREYWIIDPRPGRRRVDCYWLTPEGVYQATLPDEGGRYRSVILPGFWFRPGWLWAEPPYDPLDALAEVRGLSAEAIRSLRELLGGVQGPKQSIR